MGHEVGLLAEWVTGEVGIRHGVGTREVGMGTYNGDWESGDGDWCTVLRKSEVDIGRGTG